MFSFGNKTKCVKTGVSTPISETKASLTIQTALKIEAKPLGVLGNAITITAVANSIDTLAVSVTDSAITILLANTTGSKNTMTLIGALIDSTPAVSALIGEYIITGATQMTAFNATALSGGLNGSIGSLGEVRFDTDGNRWELIHDIGGVYYWALDKDNYPALDTEYVSHYDKMLDKIVLKQMKDYGFMPNTGTVPIAHGIAMAKVYDYTYSWENRTTFGGQFNGNSAASTSTVRAVVDLANMTIASSYNVSVNKAYFRIRYTKA